MATSIGTATSPGPRPDNQDRCFAAARVGILSDGMGGHAGGARAAELTVAAARAVLDAAPAIDDAVLGDVFTAANDAVRRGRASDAEVRSMGATLTLAVRTEQPGHWFVAHVGDSPAFHVRGANAMPITADHTVPGQLLLQGSITRHQAENHRYRNMLLRAVGVEDDLVPDITEVRLEPGESLVLASDGVTDVVAPDVIGRLVAEASTARAAAELLIAEAIARQTCDNVTAVVLRDVASSPHDEPAG